MASGVSLLQALLSHLTLPPRLPQGEDLPDSKLAPEITRLVLKGLKHLRELTGGAYADEYDNVRRSLLASLSLQGENGCDKAGLLKQFAALQEATSAAFFFLHIPAQNAGLLIWKKQDYLCDRVILEAFEASPSSDAVLGSQCLQMDFPGSSVSLDMDEFSNPDFQECCANFLCSAATEIIPEFAAKAYKAGIEIVETRNTAEPVLITSMFMTMMLHFGESAATECPLIRKRVRDDCIWSEGSAAPWRRAPSYLVLRIALRRLLWLHFGDEGTVHYKFIIASILATLLPSTLGRVDVEQVSFLKAKLGRRIGKLAKFIEVCQDHHQPAARLMTATRASFLNVLQCANSRILGGWEKWKQSNRRAVEPFKHHKASPVSQELKLFNSYRIIKSILEDYAKPAMPDNKNSSASMRIPLKAWASSLRDLTDQYGTLHDQDLMLQRIASSTIPSAAPEPCVNLSASILKQVESVLKAEYGGVHAETFSTSILTILELWVEMDKSAVMRYPLLGRYFHGFPDDLLDVLQLQSYKDLRRIHRVHSYLRSRTQRANIVGTTIFDKVSPQAFAVQYYNDSASMQQLMQEVEEAAAKRREAKEHEWEAKNAKFEEFKRKLAEHPNCVTSMQEEWPYEILHDDKACTKCYLERRIRGLRIEVCEHPLPENEDNTQAKAVIFELCIDEAFCAYRDATFAILGRLAFFSHHSTTRTPWLLLEEYPGLKPVTRSYASRSFGLASTVKKAFGQTHYRALHFPSDKDRVCVPCGVHYTYYDSTSETHARDVVQHSLRHHFRCDLPPEAPLSKTLEAEAFKPGAPNGPASNHIIASQHRCPKSMNMFEYLSTQMLYNGLHRRWYGILAELGSSNLNFSAESTVVILARLFHELGSAGAHDEEPNILRIAHLAFKQHSFCDQVLRQVEDRMSLLAQNFREHNTMETLIMLLLRVVSLSDAEDADKALHLLAAARDVTKNWMELLRGETFQAKENDSLSLTLGYALRASLLCRKTFEIFKSGYCCSLSGSSDLNLTREDLDTFLTSSLILQDCMRHSSGRMSTTIRAALVSDISITSSIHKSIRDQLIAHPDALLVALNSIWPEPTGCIRRCTNVKVPPKLTRDPVTAVIETSGRSSQKLEFHALNGHVLLDGEAIGRLPDSFSRCKILQELMGDQNLYCTASDLPQMTHVLHMSPKGHQIHVGTIAGCVVVRVCVYGRTYQVLDRDIFYGLSGSFDLPCPLVEDCLHFLDLNSRIIEVRKKSAPWTINNHCWKINLSSRIGYRGAAGSLTHLVDVNSFYFGFVASIFRDFEDRRCIIVHQPSRYPCFVELPRLELTWYIGKNQLLYCKQLGAEIDPNQDAGTFYGLASAIVVRDEFNHTKRSILVPVGDIQVARNGFHVRATISNQGAYASFSIDSILGRLACASDSRVICYMTLLHAITSFIIPDPLLGRTGTEEALGLLEGYCQPSEPLSTAAYACLTQLAGLTPQRSWYPADQRMLQTVTWDDRLTTTVQHEGYAHMVRGIVERSNRLALFYGAPQIEWLGTSTGSLNKRAFVRRSHFYPLEAVFSALRMPADTVHVGRHIPKTTIDFADLMTSINLGPQQLRTPENISSLLQTFPNIGGFAHTYDDQTLLHKALTADFAIQFGAMINFCKASTRANKWTLAFAIAPFAFQKHANFDMLYSWLAFAIFEELKSIEAPEWPAYSHYRKDTYPTVNTILPLLQNAVLAKDAVEREHLNFALNRKNMDGLQGSEKRRFAAIEAEMQSFAQHVMAQWPTHEPSSAGFDAQFLDLEKAMAPVTPELQRLYENIELSNYIVAVQTVFDARRCDTNPLGRMLCQAITHVQSSHRCSVVATLRGDLLPHSPHVSPPVSSNKDATRPSRLSAKSSVFTTNRMVKVSQDPEGTIPELRKILNTLSIGTSEVRSRYFEDLKASLSVFETRSQHTTAPTAHYDLISAGTRLRHAHSTVQQRLENMRSAMTNCHAEYIWLRLAGVWPTMSAVAFVESLRPTSDVSFGQNTKSMVVELALALTDQQYASRIFDHASRNDWKKLSAEVSEGQRRAFSPQEYPEWLLIELECNLRIRANQVEVALASIKPSNGQNSVLQMNMGLGKTSVIMPSIAAHLAGQRKDIMRVVVPRSLLAQTSVLLHHRLGRLLGCKILHLPYSRQIDHSESTTEIWRQLHANAQKEGSVILAAPEHILSFKLCGLQALSDDLIDRARKLMDTQSWLEENCRDLVDESDYILSPKSGLTFPSGAVSAPDGAPFRWTMAQNLFALAETHLAALKNDFPSSIEIVPRDGGFPTLHFLRRDVEEALLKRLLSSLTSGHEALLDLRDMAPCDRELVKRFLSDPIIPEEETKKLAMIFRDNPDMTKRLLLLRGLLVQRILIMALKKRFNVQYGIDGRRAPIAVPFISKGTPTELSEWGHPDVAILLTILSFYYTGLSLQQVRQALSNISKADDPVRVYDSFVQGSSIPDSLRDYDNINEDDGFQVNMLWKHVRFSTTVVDYFLNHFVFPRFAKQFSIKLQTNAFDLPLMPSDPKVVKVKTTGFSGTNDNRNLLPLTCPQTDLSSLQHTNAMVLTYLLARRNRCYHVACDPVSKKRLTEVGLLKLLKSLKIRTLIDSGAMILEMSNADLARTWLEIDPEALGAVYFNTKNEPIVRFRGGKEMPLLMSNITDLSQMLVYIDESHTRGTDLPLSDLCTGALTLGLSITKDAVMQAAMRLRKLGSTQSVVFIAPLEVHQAILDCRQKDRTGPLDSADIIRWLLQATAASLESLVPLYYANGTNFLTRTQAAWDNWNLLYDREHTDEFLMKVREKEKLTLNRLYQPRYTSKISRETKDYVTAPHLRKMFSKLDKQRHLFRDDGSAVHASALEELEQEAQKEVEVEVEVETIRERQTPPRYHPCTYQGLHPEIESFVQTGRLNPARGGFEHAFAALRRSATGKKHGIKESALQSRLYASFEFTRTVTFPDSKPDDAMLRPVQHVLFFPGTSLLPVTALLISQEEADDCLHLVQHTRGPLVHVLLYTAPVTRRMLHFNNLDYCAVPPLPVGFKAPMWLTVELGIIAGRLYFEFEEYHTIKDFLGVSDEEIAAESAVRHSPNEAANEHDLKPEVRKSTSAARKVCQFTTKPVAFMNEYLMALRKESDITATPMGYLLSHKPLTPNHSFFAPRRIEDVQKKLASIRQETIEEHDDEGDVVDDLELHVAGLIEEDFQTEVGDDEVGEDWYEDKAGLGELSGKGSTVDKKEDAAW